MLKKRFTRAASFLCLSALLFARISSAQSCPENVNGAYSYTVIGTGVPGALFTGESASAIPAYSNTPLGRLLDGPNNTGPSSSAGTLAFDGMGGITAKSSAQGGTTMSVGSYVVNSDCTMTVQLSDAFGTNPTVTNLQGVILSNGGEIDLGVVQDTSAATSGSPGICGGHVSVQCADQAGSTLGHLLLPRQPNGSVFLSGVWNAGCTNRTDRRKSDRSFVLPVRFGPIRWQRVNSVPARISVHAELSPVGRILHDRQRLHRHHGSQQWLGAFGCRGPGCSPESHAGGEFCPHPADGSIQPPYHYIHHVERDANAGRLRPATTIAFVLVYGSSFVAFARNSNRLLRKPSNRRRFSR